MVTAPPGTGKTTLLPPAVAVALAGHEASAGRVLVTQPRRVAARAAARRIARLLGEEVGGQVGYSVRGDSRVSGRTRVEMVTPGVALRRLQRDPELPGVAGIIIDEFHERDLDTDLALAFALDARAALREDLFIALAGAALLATRTDASIDKGVLRATRTRTLGAIPLSSSPARALSEEEATALVADHLASRGLGELGWGKEASSLRERMRALHEALGAPWPDVSDQALAGSARQWLAPWGRRLASGTPLSTVSMLDALRSMLPWPQAARLDELAPEKLPIPSGGTRSIDWSGAHPVLTLRVQQAFGGRTRPGSSTGACPWCCT